MIDDGINSLLDIQNIDNIIKIKADHTLILIVNSELLCQQSHSWKKYKLNFQHGSILMFPIISVLQAKFFQLFNFFKSQK